MSTATVYVHPLMAAKEFGEWIRERMGALGLSQAGLARQADVNEGSLSRYRRGLVTPDPETIYKLAGPLQADPEELLMIAGHKKTDDLSGVGRTLIIRTDNPDIVHLVRVAEEYTDEEFETALRLLRNLYPRGKE